MARFQFDSAILLDLTQLNFTCRVPDKLSTRLSTEVARCLASFSMSIRRPGSRRETCDGSSEASRSPAELLPDLGGRRLGLSSGDTGGLKLGFSLCHRNESWTSLEVRY